MNLHFLQIGVIERVIVESCNTVGNVEIGQASTVSESVTDNGLDTFGDDGVTASEEQCVCCRHDECVTVVSRVILAVTFHHHNRTQVPAVLERLTADAVDAVAHH